ncbi:translation initiation factor IF-2-like [Homarus americanus]|uniref:translation initiation factor IF-2-like n=1 Tax=Homarus americanus TaxID=6706 RepID=UPI001C4682AC|nr:translation initiation factor IF-2-like [Homarus americanus]XP_042228191.1 translation initiation factor IF-2-like [Homarus americanus]XP_042228193.1 translation initiation factor IF-2-like [Homarus americanus]
MDLWKPAVRKAKKVSSSSGGSDGNGGDKCDWAGTLPDVVADLTLADTPFTHHSAMLGTRDHHYLDMGDARSRRRDARPPPPPVTPQGLGAAPQGLGAAPTQSMVSGGGATGGTTSGWRHNPQHPWPSQPPLDPPGGVTMSSGVGVGVGCIVGSLPVESEGARVRSASSEPRGPAGNGSDRRVRCSSASRSRQHRPRPPPGDRPPGNTNVPPTSLPPGGSGHGGQQPYSPPVGSSQPGGGVGMVGGVLARLAGCYENLEPGREPGEGVAYGYQVSDLEALLTEASPSRPANLPMVLASSTRLHNMRRTPEPRPHNQQPVRPFLPLGIIVNAVFKTRDWLYVRTAHGAEGYVPYRVCLPLGILPPPREGHAVSPGVTDVGGGGVWESRTDMFQGGMAQLPGAPAAPPTTGGMGGVGTEAGGQTRGRTRGRRRPPCIDSSNQTDTQKLQPGPRSLSETRSPRETLEPPAVAPAAVAAIPVATSPDDHVLV